MEPCGARARCDGYFTDRRVATRIADDRRVLSRTEGACSEPRDAPNREDGLCQLAISLTLTAVLFAAIYKVLPDKPIAWRDVAVGGAVTAVLFTVGKSVIGLYIGSSTVAPSYAAAGAFDHPCYGYIILPRSFFSAPSSRASMRRGAKSTPGGTPPCSPVPMCICERLRYRQSGPGGVSLLRIGPNRAPLGRAQSLIVLVRT